MSSKAQVAIAYSQLFPNVAESYPGLIKKFAKIFKFARAYAKNRLDVDLTKIDVFEFIDERENVNRDLLQYAAHYYENETTRSSQLSVLKALALAELEAIRRRETLRSESALDCLVAVDKLKPHLKELWLHMPRQAKGSNARDVERRKQFPLNTSGKYILKTLLVVDARHKTTSARELFSEHYFEIRREVTLNVPHQHRKVVFRDLYRVAKQLGISSVKSRLPALEIDDLPEKLRKQVLNFEERAPIGLGAFENLKKLASKNKFKRLKGWRVSSVYNAIGALLTAAPYMELGDEVGVEDLLRLETHGEDPDEKINSYIERYRAVELARENPGYKQKDYDSVNFSMLVFALCAIGRFNGIFDLQEKFHSHYKISLDLDSRSLRKSLKKKKMSRKWIDDWIWQTKPEFDEIINKRSFLTSARDRKLCLFYVQLIVLRFLGFRQECLRKCVVGKHIIFGKDSVSFHYEPGEIKNEVLIDQTLSKKLHGGITEIVLLIDVLKKYKYGLLDVIRAEFPLLYKTSMGEAFFAISNSEKRGLIRKYETGEEGESNLVQFRRSTRGRKAVRDIFTTSAYTFMNCARLSDFPYHFNPHFLRGVCCDWLIKDLKMTWEEVSKCMGDRESTLKREYYEEGRRVQDATDALARVSRERKEDSVNKENAEGMSQAALRAVQKSLDMMSNQFKKMEERAERAEKEAALAKSQVEFLLRRQNITAAELVAATSPAAVSI
jgi:hypothetical protein